jgi:hypothetical protein
MGEAQAPFIVAAKNAFFFKCVHGQSEVIQDPCGCGRVKKGEWENRRGEGRAGPRIERAPSGLRGTLRRGPHGWGLGLWRQLVHQIVQFATF